MTDKFWMKNVKDLGSVCQLSTFVVIFILFFMLMLCETLRIGSETTHASIVRFRLRFRCFFCFVLVES